MRIVYELLAFLFLISCAGLDIKILNEKDYYSESFLKKLESIQIIYRDGDKRLALKKVDELADDKITSAEQAKKYNLKGVMYFSLGDTDKSIENFELAKSLVKEDLFLFNNISLNLASAFFKMNRYMKTYSYLEQVDLTYLKEKEQVNYHRLSFTVGNQLEKHSAVVDSLLFLMKDLKNLKQVEDFKSKEILVDNYRKLSESARVYLLEQKYKISPMACAYLAKQEAMSRFYQGKREAAQDVVDWLEKNFRSNQDVLKFVNNYKFRAENYSKINSKSIGLIAPLKGNVGKYGQKVVSGINTALLENKSNHGLRVYVKDNGNNTFLAKKQIQELAIKENVAIIVGGLFPQLATAEYLEARKYGILYISLSPVYLPRSEKNHLLIEIPGSVESQIAEVLRPEILEKFGKRVSIIYPWSDMGQSYVDELWSFHNSETINLTNISDYEAGISDYREPVKTLLGLKYPRERKEEFDVWSEIKNVNKHKVRIVNVLPPVIDFDWVFIPSLPRDALQIIPTFGFYDVKGMKFVGGPSWVNQKIQSERRNFAGNVYVIGNDTVNVSDAFAEKYKTINGQPPHLVDTLSFEGGKLILNILGGQSFAERSDLEKKMLNSEKVESVNSKWILQKGVWIKRMDLLEVKSSGFKKVI